MNLKDYIVAFPGKGVAFAGLIGVAPAYLSQMLNGHRSVSPERALAIEQATNGQVTRRELRPDDYWLIWPDLPAPELAKEGV